MKTATTPAPIPSVKHKLENNEFVHFGLQSGDTLEVKTDVGWQDVKPRQLCLVQRNSPTGFQWLAAVEPNPHPEAILPEERHKTFFVLHNGFFKGSSLYCKDVLKLIGGSLPAFIGTCGNRSNR